MSASGVRRLADRLDGARMRIRALPGGTIAWRVLVTLVGVAIIVLGIILLPLPGPGWLIIFAGLGLLATEYAWASRLLQRTRRYVLAWTRWAARQSLFVQFLIGLAGLLVVGSALWLAWWLVS
ncbi:TIGR02611 family protein [Jatrophihabitans cynanchi]|jgi:uncharacterized protein (TIGR02611 family)|uniref:TIGR02611 family protein n=1 Tax=Jatrophihabitans cynanchi TaxID=2944128 RepID=A0ABY7K2B7_9ACTN|nr:TIGR02611 family protein [Jatrophihabitans sp. SB3-54]WAX57692.1 TIGR02611 family protein [Jatrophihabitans sp. SB3-54]